MKGGRLPGHALDAVGGGTSCPPMMGRLSQECATKIPVEGLKTLYDGLKNIKVAGNPRTLLSAGHPLPDNHH